MHMFLSKFFLLFKVFVKKMNFTSFLENNYQQRRSIFLKKIHIFIAKVKQGLIWEDCRRMLFLLYLYLYLQVYLLVKLLLFLHPSMDCFHIWLACVSYRSAHFEWWFVKVSFIIRGQRSTEHIGQQVYL